MSNISSFTAWNFQNLKLNFDEKFHVQCIAYNVKFIVSLSWFRKNKLEIDFNSKHKDKITYKRFPKYMRVWFSVQYSIWRKLPRYGVLGVGPLSIRH